MTELHSSPTMSLSSATTLTSGNDEASYALLTVDVLFMLVLLLAGATVFMTFSKRLFLPYTVVLFLYGIVMGAVWLKVSPEVAHALGSIPTDLLLYIFLPVLIFEGSYSMNIHALRRVFLHATLLATVGVVLNTVLLGLPIKLLLSDWSWYAVMLLGSLLSATDPVAVVTLLKDLGVDQSVTALLDSESVMNDGTAIIAFGLLYPAAYTGRFVRAPGMVVLDCLRLCVLPLVVGPCFGFVQYFWLRRARDGLTKACITVSVTYVSYYVAYFLIGTSGVLVVFFQGIFLSYYYPSLFPGRHGTSSIYVTWEFLVHLGNTVLFALVGVILVADVLPTLTPRDLVTIVVTYLVMNLARLAMLELLLPVLNCLPGFALSQRVVLLMVHSGLRGGLAVALALGAKQGGLKEGVATLKVTAGVVLLSLLINASFAGRVVRLLGFNIKAKYRVMQMNYAMDYLTDTERRAVEGLKRDTKYQNANWLAVEHFVDRHVRNPFQGSRIEYETDDVALNRLLMSAFKTSLWRQRDEQRISETAVVQLGGVVARAMARGELFDVRKLKLFVRKRDRRGVAADAPVVASGEAQADVVGSEDNGRQMAHSLRVALPSEEEMLHVNEAGGRNNSSPRMRTYKSADSVVVSERATGDTGLSTRADVLTPDGTGGGRWQIDGTMTHTLTASTPPPRQRIMTRMSAGHMSAPDESHTEPALQTRRDSAEAGLAMRDALSDTDGRWREGVQQTAVTHRDVLDARTRDVDAEVSSGERFAVPDAKRSAVQGRVLPITPLATPNVGRRGEAEDTNADVPATRPAVQVRSDDIAEVLMRRLLPTWVVLLERIGCFGAGFFKQAHRRAQENAFMVLLAVVQCLRDVAQVKYTYVRSPAQTARVDHWLTTQLMHANAAIRFFYAAFPAATNSVASTRAVLSVASRLQSALRDLHTDQGFGLHVKQLLSDMIDELRKSLPAHWRCAVPTTESDLVMQAVAASTLGQRLKRAEVRAIAAMGLVRTLPEGHLLTLPENAFLIVVFGSLRAVHGAWTTVNEYELIESFGDTVGLDSFLLPEALRSDQQRQWRVVSTEATLLLISFNSIKPFLMERSLYSVKALWRAAAAEVLLPLLQDMISLTAAEAVNGRERLTSIIMEGTPLIGPQDCAQFNWNSQFHLCFYLRGTDADGLFSGHTPPCYVSTFYARQLRWDAADVVLYAVPMNVSSDGYVPWNEPPPRLPPVNGANGNPDTAHGSTSSSPDGALARRCSSHNTATSILNKLLLGQVPREEDEEEGTSSALRSPLSASLPETPVSLTGPQSPTILRSSLSFSDSFVFTSSAVCILQSLSDFVTPVPYVNQLFAQYASMLEQVCLAALRYLRHPYDPPSARHAERTAEWTIEFLLNFCLEISLLRRATAQLQARYPNAFHDLVLDDAYDALFQCKVCAWTRNNALTHKYHLRTLIVEMNAFANRRFKVYVTALRVMVTVVPELRRAESVEGLHSLMLTVTADTAAS